MSGIGKIANNRFYVPYSLVRDSLLMLKPYVIINAFQHDESFRARYLFVNRIFFASIPESMRYHAILNKFVKFLQSAGNTA